MCFPQRPSRSSNRGPRSRGSLSPSRCCALDSAFSATFCLAASPIRLVSIHPTSNLSRVAFSAVPDGELHAPYFTEWSLGLEHQLGNTGSIHAQYVGTRAVNQPYVTQ